MHVNFSSPQYLARSPTTTTITSLSFAYLSVVGKSDVSSGSIEAPLQYNTSPLLKLFLTPSNTVYAFSLAGGGTSLV